MQDELIPQETIKNISFITNTLFDVLSIFLIIIMIVCIIKLYGKITKLIEQNSH